MTASTSDYAWFSDFRRGWLSESYCLSLIQGLAPAEFLARLGADVQGEFQGLEAYADLDEEFQDGQVVYGDYMLVGAASVPGSDGPWTLALEVNGSLGIDDRFMGPASAGTQAISHFRNAKAITYFHWWQDGEKRTAFEWPRERSGSTPDALLEVMQRVGYDLDSDDRDLGTPGLFALAEELTGVRVTAEMLESATYTAGIVTIPDQEWTSVVIHSTDATGERTYKEITREQVEQAMAEHREQSARPLPPHPDPIVFRLESDPQPDQT
ncbi:hypothetical protein DZF91_04990 [Actinomadura logoneensis]|uniref:Uncharacterized protein n=1 Tax=Actinomadura logoneensis TaxID=2293572 RepID=A0A372JRX5_9ACTN|nr:DUF6461 domain-containing protein [Actinomadura logoneensis]RFU42767.1 hypothetical protein DZF91_04990 [Actinomadura logoneensis]